MPSSLRTWANFTGSARRPLAIIARNAARPASVKKETRQAERGVEAHQSALDQAFRGGRQFWLPRVRTTPPHSQLEAVRDRRQIREKPVQLTSYVSSLNRREVGGCRFFRGVHDDRHSIQAAPGRARGRPEAETSSVTSPPACSALAPGGTPERWSSAGPRLPARRQHGGERRARSDGSAVASRALGRARGAARAAFVPVC
jgi:hypothetical protein